MPPTHCPPGSFGPGLALVALGLLAAAFLAHFDRVPAPGALLAADAPVERVRVFLPDRPRRPLRTAALHVPSPEADSATAPVDSSRTLVVAPLLPIPTPPAAPSPAAPPPYPLVVPVAGVAPGALLDTFGDFRADSTRIHKAIDILAPTGTPVVAAAPGRVVRLFESSVGGLTVYQLGPEGRYVYYYAHLDRYADGLAAGQRVAEGDTLGTVGHTGNADEAVPHLHFAIWQQRRGSGGWGGRAVNPYAALTR